MAEYAVDTLLLSGIPPLALPLFFMVAWMYASVGHGGASGYLALFTIFGVAAAEMVPAALLLNILVAGVGTWHFYRAGHLRPRMLLPFVLSSIPAAFLGGLLPVPQTLFALLLGAALLLAAWRLLFFRMEARTLRQIDGRRLWQRALPLGALLGFLAGMIGIGGGVFLSPLLLLLRWADVRQTAAISAAFIVLNSLSGMAGQLLQRSVDPVPVLLLAAVVGAGGWFGSRAGAFSLRPNTVRLVLAAVLLLAGGKLIGRMLMGLA